MLVIRIISLLVIIGSRSFQSSVTAHFVIDPCFFGKIVTGNKGTIESPNYPNSYTNNLSCQWIIRVNQTKRIALKFNRTFGVESGPTGCFDSVQIIEGNTSLEYCGPNPAVSYLSEGSTLTLKFASDNFTVDLGFSIQWQAIDKSVIPDKVMVDVSSTTGVITSPNYPQNYTNLLSYTWKMKSEGKFFRFKIDSISMEGSTAIQCPYDRLVFSTVDLAESTIVCGTQAPRLITIFASEVLVTFTTDVSNVSSGFSFNHKPINVITCEEPFRVSGTSGVITSPYHPSPYNDNLNCTWHIEAPENTLIAVRFNDPFNIYQPPYSDCFEDLLQIFDGPSTASLKFTGEDFCGLYHPRGFLSSGNTLTIVFFSGSGVHGEGFSFNWTTEAACEKNEFRCWEGECINESMACDGKVDCSNDIADEAECGTNETSATCGTPAIPADYKWDPRIVGGSEAVQGSWPWQAGLYYVIYSPVFRCGAVLISNELAMTAAHCIEPFFKRAGYTLEVLLGDHNQTDDDVLREQSRAVKRIFVHPQYDFRSSEGFLYGYDIAILQLSSPINRTVWVRPVCLPPANLEPVTDTYAVITGWGATVPTGFHNPSKLHQVRVKVIDYDACNKGFHLREKFDLPSNVICVGLFDTGGASPCFSDSGGPIVQLMNGKWVVIGLVSFGLNCGAVPGFQAGQTQVSSHVRYIESFLNGSALQIDDKYEVILNTDEGTISSRNYGNIAQPWYEPFTKTTWYIITSPETRMLVKFNTTFHIENSDGCRFDHLTIYDGLSLLAPMYLNKKLCGMQVPPDFLSDKNGIIVEFVTDSFFQEVGFSFNWTAIVCMENELQEGSSGIITLPTVAGVYPHNLMCSWLLRGPENTLLQIRFTYFDVEFPCVYDYLVMYDGNSSAARKIFDDVLCGRNITVRAFESSSNEVFVAFKSDEIVAFTGFNLSWIAVENCESTEFRCWNGACIDKSKQCDKTFDCKDHSDEIECKLEPQICGTPEIEAEYLWDSRIVGGSFSVRGSWPWHVGIAYRYSPFPHQLPLCGASLVNARWVLTAAHCVVFQSLIVILGEHNTSSFIGNVAIVNVTAIHIHPFYKSTSEVEENDIALLELENAVTFNTYIKPICLPSKSTPVPVGDICVVTGWGRTMEGGRGSRVLRQVRIPILSQDICAKPLAEYNADYMICGGNYESGGADACQGDSGGPLVCFGQNSWYQLGIVSFGKGCARPRQPGYYTFVPFYEDWINNTTLTSPTTQVSTPTSTTTAEPISTTASITTAEPISTTASITTAEPISTTASITTAEPISTTASDTTAEPATVVATSQQPEAETTAAENTTVVDPTTKAGSSKLSSSIAAAVMFSASVLIIIV